MKSSLILSLFSFVCISLMGQNLEQAYMDLERHLNTSGEYLKRADDRNKVIGSPYLTEDFQPGMVHWNRMWNEGIDLKYDIYHDCFEVKLKSGIIVLDPLKNNIDTIKYNGEAFVRKFLDQGKGMSLAYMALLGQENVYSVYKQYKIILTEASSSDGYSNAKPAEFKSNSPVYYIFKDNENWEVKGSRTIAEIFGIEAKMVKDYMKEKNYKLSNEKDLVEVILYFSKPLNQS
jgi:hypothetical protein